MFLRPIFYKEAATFLLEQETHEKETNFSTSCNKLSRGKVTNAGSICVFFFLGWQSRGFRTYK